MRKVWVVVVNRVEMKIFRAENVQTLIEIASQRHSKGQLSNHDLTSDKQGSHRGLFGTDTMEEKTPASVKEANHFANQVAKFLEDGVNRGDVERLYMIAPPEFMGILRQAMKPHVTKLVEKEIDKDIIHAPPKQIREYLPPVL